MQKKTPDNFLCNSKEEEVSLDNAVLVLDFKQFTIDRPISSYLFYNLLFYIIDLA